ncbi:MAG: hypothetical protein GX452_13335, partial [Ignavibacteriales bacterium]|nr:hypothetical protein [Ignavibacteriales bacterium]
FCHDFDKVATELFLDSDLSKKIPSFPGRIELETRTVRYNSTEATEIHVFTEPKDIKYNPAILEQVPAAIKSLESELAYDVTIINGAMPLWLVSQLTTLLKPISAVVAIYDKKVKNDDGTLHGAVVVSGDNKNKYGTILKKEE